MRTISGLKKYLCNFLGIKIGFGDFEIIVLRYILKSQTAPADNFLIQTQGQWEVERPALLSGCGEVNGKFHGFQVNIFRPKTISDWDSSAKTMRPIFQCFS